MASEQTSSRTLSADLSIIGSGSGNSLITPFWDDKQVVLADRGVGPDQVFGGTCLNVGCIPTKMFVRPAALASSTEEAARLGVTQQTTAVDWPAMRDRIFGRIDAISAAGRAYRDEELDNVELLSASVTLDPDLLARREQTGGFSFTTASDDVAETSTQVEAEQLVLAAGSRPVMPEVPGIDLPQVYTSDSVMRIDELPRRVLIVGGGYIACEFAGIFSGLGVEVIQANRSVGLMSALDEDIARAYSAQAEQSWKVLYQRTLGAVVERDASGTGDREGVTAQLVTSDGREEDYEVDLVLVAIGRRPNSDLLGAEQAGLDLHDDGRIAVDEYQRVLAGGSPVDGLYALGDLSSVTQLKHVANHEARVVAHNLENPDGLRAARHHAIPGAVFSLPEMSTVGLTEAAAVAAVGEHNVTTKIQDYGDTAYGWAMEESKGIFKAVADRRDGTLLGAHVMGYQASNLIQPVVQAMSFGQDAYTVARGQYWIHPALMEVTENALLGLDVPVPADAPL